MNKVILSGNVGKDPEIRTTNGGTAIATFTIATSDYAGKKDGKSNYETEWHNVKVFGKLAEVVRDKVKKGASVLLTGRIKTESWTPKDGGDTKSIKLILVGLSDQLEIMKVAGGNSNSSAPAASSTVDEDEDIPF